MDEFARIAAIEARLGGDWSAVQIGIGDDAAVLACDPRPQVLSVDAAVEGVHFEWHLGSARALGRRAAVAALSDLAAMGATPRAMLSALTLPEDFDGARLMAFVDGLADAAREYDAPVVGGNLTRGRTFAANTTVVGALDGPAIGRRGARVGDQLYLTGPVGGAALGLRLLLADRRAPFPGLCAMWLRPHARIEAGLRLQGLAHAAIDISDGVLQDLGHLCRASGVGARIDAAALPLATDACEAAAAIGEDATLLALGGGEDFELLFAAAADAPIEGHWIGEIVADQIVVAYDGAGHPIAVPNGGYRHF